jgi:DNA (cytosine-5)-methyltransferase 1
MKCAAYRANYPEDTIVQGDVWDLDAKQVPTANLAWASFPCQDLSLAGGRRGLNAPRSGAFWGFWNVIGKQRNDAPKTIVIENVVGLLSSHRGGDFAELITTLIDAGYRVGAMMIDASLFSPQSRPRLFIVAYRGAPPDHLVIDDPDPLFHTSAIVAAARKLPPRARKAWVWWRLPKPPERKQSLASVLERTPPDKVWRDEAATRKLLSQMKPLHRRRVEVALAQDGMQVGAVFRRIRIEKSKRVQRAEIRYDGLAGCLRTPAGGSSKQLLLITKDGRVRLRPLLGREAARLMGVSENYILPSRESAALKVFGDGVCVGAVKWLGENLLLPLATAKPAPAKSKSTSLPSPKKDRRRRKDLPLPQQQPQSKSSTMVMRRTR